MPHSAGILRADPNGAAAAPGSGEATLPQLGAAHSILVSGDDPQQCEGNQ